MTLLDELLKRVAADLAAQFDATLVRLITGRLGPYWRLPDLVGRLYCVASHGSQIEEYQLDGNLLCQVWPPSYRLGEDGLAHISRKIIEATNEKAPKA